MEGEQNVEGDFHGSSHWVEVAIMQTTTQVPGIYVDVTNSTVMFFDHQRQLLLIKINRKESHLELRNPTAYSTTYTVFLDLNNEKTMS